MPLRQGQEIQEMLRRRLAEPSGDTNQDQRQRGRRQGSLGFASALA